MKRGEQIQHVSRPSNPPDEFAQTVSKKSLSDELFLQFFFESSESERVFNYLHDSNSIFRARRIKSEGVSGGTVVSYEVPLPEFMTRLHFLLRHVRHICLLGPKFLH